MLDYEIGFLSARVPSGLLTAQPHLRETLDRMDYLYAWTDRRGNEVYLALGPYVLWRLWRWITRRPPVEPACGGKVSP